MTNTTPVKAKVAAPADPLAVDRRCACGALLVEGACRNCGRTESNRAAAQAGKSPDHSAFFTMDRPRR